MMRPTRPILLALAFLLGASTPARADITAFLGLITPPSTRATKGVALGFSLVIVGFEFEYADSTEDIDELAPSLKTGMVNGFLQTPFPVAGTQFYVTAGGGVYRERLVDAQETHVGVNVGGGAKIKLAGPLRVRLDYRIFKLSGSPLHSRPQRFYAGLNLQF